MAEDRPRKPRARKTAALAAAARTSSDRKTSDRSTSDRKSNDRNPSDRKSNDRNFSDRSASSRPPSGRKSDGRSADPRKSDERWTKDRKSNARKADERATSGRSTTSRTSGSRDAGSSRTDDRWSKDRPTDSRDSDRRDKRNGTRDNKRSTTRSGTTPDRSRSGGRGPARSDSRGGRDERRNDSRSSTRQSSNDYYEDAPEYETGELVSRSRQRVASQEAQAVSFAACGVPPEMVKVLANIGITKPFPIQAATIADAIKGRDVLGRGRTGSGKTLAFALPVVTRLMGVRSEPKRPRAVILAPTRELASQIHATFAPLAASVGLRTVAIYGGAAPGPQISALKRGVDIVVATPGRLKDHLNSGYARLDHVEIAVIDEADHMSDLGFLPDVRELLDMMPRDGQRLLFSATLDGDVDVLVQQYLDSPATHSVDDGQDSGQATHHVLRVDSHDRFAVMTDLAQAPGRTIVFTRTRLGAASLTEAFNKAGVAAVDLHGDLSQAVRARNLRAFTQGRATTLVATDIAARGIHVDDVARVVHADPPDEHKAYVHRSGRTARAGAEGTVVTMMTGKQTRIVRELTRRAGIEATTTRVTASDPFLQKIAPGERVASSVIPEPKSEAAKHGGRPRHSGGYKGSGGGSSRGGSRSNDRGQGGRGRGGKRAR